MIVVEMMMLVLGLGFLVMGYMFRKMCQAKDRATTYVSNTGLVKRLSDSSQVAAAELRKKARYASLMCQAEAVKRIPSSWSDKLMGEVNQ